MPDDPLIGHQLGNFRVERVIGRGGMATVYFGTDVRLQRPVAIKVVDARYRGDMEYAQRFIREARAVAAWRHENIVQIYHADEADGLFFFAMEYIDGKDLGQINEEYSAARKHMPAADVLGIARAVASALDYAHQRGVIHRDVKPSNVLVARDSRIVLADFGLALDIEQGSFGDVFGSAHYVAPEQARHSSDARPQSDLYSLGVILYELLTGRVPFDDPSPTSVAIQHITLAPPEPRSLNPDLSQEIQAVLLKALSKNPAERYQTGAEFVAALQLALPADLVTAPGRRPLAQIVALSASGVMPAAAVAVPAGQPAPQSNLLKPRPLNVVPMLWAAGGCSLALVFVVALSGLVVLRQQTALTPSATKRPSSEPTAVSSPMAASPVVATPVIASPTLPATLTPEPTNPPASPTPTVQSLPVATASPAPSQTAPALPTPTSTVKYPNGHHFTLFYNNNSLYMLNRSDSIISIYPFAFERLSASGQALNRFDGWRWGQFYPTIKPGWCTQILIIGSHPYLNPRECQNRALSTRTPVAGDPVIFWTTQPGSEQFRVIWKTGTQETELALCEISIGTCEFFTP
jgi:serine/threonine protein kinase